MPQLKKVSGVATSIRTSQGVTSVVYHNTEVVRFSAQEITLNSGGWRTSTTKTRMNQASNQFGLGYYVYQKDYSWYVSYHGETIEFRDGMILSRQ